MSDEHITCRHCGRHNQPEGNECCECGSELAAPPGSVRLSGNTLASILVRHGIIDPCAVEDAEGYDGGMTILRVRTAAQEITETLAPNK